MSISLEIGSGTLVLLEPIPRECDEVLALYILTLLCIFSILFSIHFLRS